METLTVQLKLRKANAWDLSVNKKTLRYGQPFWVKSKITGEFDNKAQIISQETDIRELSNWLKEGMIYVPASDVEMKSINNSGTAVAI